VHLIGFITRKVIWVWQGNNSCCSVAQKCNIRLFAFKTSDMKYVCMLGSHWSMCEIHGEAEVILRPLRLNFQQLIGGSTNLPRSSIFCILVPSPRF
jgi:hypothetical protein